MTDDSEKPDYFQYRWGVKEWDVGFTTIPNPVLKHYSRVPWIDKNGKYGRGISNQEMLCIVHLASFHYESEEGESRPAIRTVARRMGYRKDDSVRGLIKSLEHKNLLTVERRPGKCSIYDLVNFSRAILELEGEQLPHPNGDHPNGGLSDGDYSNGPHSQGDEEKKVLEEGKQEGKEEEEKEEADSAFPEKKERTDGNSISADTGGDDPAVFGPGIDDHRGRSGEVEADPIVEAIVVQTETHPDQFDLWCETLAAQAEAGGNPAVPPPAGGSDGLVELVLAEFCRLLPEHPMEEPQGKKRGQWLREIKRILELNHVGADERGTVLKTIEVMAEHPRYNWPTYASPFENTFAQIFGTVLAQLRNGWDGQPDRKEVKADPGKYARATRMTLERLGHGDA